MIVMIFQPRRRRWPLVQQRRVVHRGQNIGTSAQRQVRLDAVPHRGLHTGSSLLPSLHLKSKVTELVHNAGTNLIIPIDVVCGIRILGNPHVIESAQAREERSADEN